VSDPRSIGDLVRLHFNAVWRTLRRFGLSEADADDAAQQVFLVLNRKLSEIESGSERAFLFGTALRIASRTRRTLRRRREVDGAATEEMLSLAPGPDAVLDRRRAAELLDQVLEEMDDTVRAVFVLHEVEELTMAEIANVLEIPPGTVASRLRRGREQFNHRLSRISSSTRSKADKQGQAT
jgi:RNA polymerase sigma-70 factor (ECF subfamily)